MSSPVNVLRTHITKAEMWGARFLKRALLAGEFFFCFFDEAFYFIGAFESGDGGSAFGEDRRGVVYVLECFYCGDSARNLFCII